MFGPRYIWSKALDVTPMTSLAQAKDGTPGMGQVALLCHFVQLQTLETQLKISNKFNTRLM